MNFKNYFFYIILIGTMKPLLILVIINQCTNTIDFKKDTVDNFGCFRLIRISENEVIDN